MLEVANQNSTFRKVSGGSGWSGFEYHLPHFVVLDMFCVTTSKMRSAAKHQLKQSFVHAVHRSRYLSLTAPTDGNQKWWS